MNDAERAEIEALAQQVCTATIRYTNGDTIHCDDHQGGRLHSNAAYGVVWSA